MTWIKSSLLLLAIGVFGAAGCSSDVCTRHSDCDPTKACSEYGVCVAILHDAAPEADGGDGSVDGGDPTVDGGHGSPDSGDGRLIPRPPLVAQPDPGPDAAAIDAGAVADAGPALDAGPSVDARPPIDAGPSVDAGPPVDASPPVDAGGVGDAAVEDAFVDDVGLPDAGPGDDARVRPDSPLTKQPQ